METMTVEITNQKAVSFLNGLEELHLIRVVKRNAEPVKKKLSDKYRGIMTREQGQDLKRHINEMRNEWDSI
jgi:hypothetical protein